MGGEIRTNVSNDFKTLEAEMGLRYDGRFLQFSYEEATY